VTVVCEAGIGHNGAETFSAVSKRFQSILQEAPPDPLLGLTYVELGLSRNTGVIAGYVSMRCRVDSHHMVNDRPLSCRQPLIVELSTDQGHDVDLVAKLSVFARLP
jgi:hypothetical protein